MGGAQKEMYIQLFSIFLGGNLLSLKNSGLKLARCSF